MENTGTISEAHQESINAVIAEITANTDAQNLDTMSTADGVTFSFAGGPGGANMQGWVTYEFNGRKLYCSGQGRMLRGHSIAQGVAIRNVMILPFELLRDAKNCTWEATGGSFCGILVIKADGRIISHQTFNSHGWGVGEWKVGGVCKFEVR